MKILIVEDDLYSRKLLENLLSIREFDFISAKNGSEALKLYPEYKPDIIITDIQMPNMSGLELLEELRKQKSDSIIIITTAFGSEEFAIKALELGANNYIKKPVQEERLMQLLNKYRNLLLEKQHKLLKIGKVTNKNFNIEFSTSVQIISKIVDRLMQELDAAFDDSEKINIELGLLEMITNAVEHGNLEITYEEKQAALNRNTIEQLYTERQNIKQLADRKIFVEFKYDQTGCQWIISDEGNGFDWQNLPDPIKSDLLELNGRGIFISKFLFDELEYMANGSTVRVKKYFW